MQRNRIFVIGSSNMDLVVDTDHIPAPGETVLSGSFMINPGGKGANQAVAAARLGGEVSFLSKLGKDEFGNRFLELFSREGIDLSFLFIDESLPNGVALITVDRNGENTIVVAPGANSALTTADVDKATDAIMTSSYLLMQLEIPMDVVEYAAAFAFKHGVRVILNPAPVAMLTESLLESVYMLTPNRNEASVISGISVTDLPSAKKAAEVITTMGVSIVIITLGAQGVLVYAAGKHTHFSAPLVTAVDTTAAGDVFNGALIVALAEGLALDEAAKFACKAAALSATRHGAQASIPWRIELNDF